MPLIIEVFKSTVDLEIAMNDVPEADPCRKLYMMGALQALTWIRDGAAKPSFIMDESAKFRDRAMPQVGTVQ
jgi:hypothetical protein